MPNHCTNWVRIEGEPDKIKDLIKRTKLDQKTDDDRYQFDFDGIIPMPDELLNTVSPTKVVMTQEEADKINNEYKENGHVSGDQEVRAITAFESGRRKKEYGADNWYDWAINNWGTKWGAYEIEHVEIGKDHIDIQFDTAWSPPEGILNKLMDEGFRVNGFWHEEGGGEGYIGDEGEETVYVYHTVDVEWSDHKTLDKAEKA